MAKTKPVVKAAALDKAVNATVDVMSTAATAANSAVIKVAAEVKKLTVEVKRQTKKKGVLAKRNVAAKAKLKKVADATNKKLVSTVGKELKSVTSAQSKARVSKAIVATELASLKVAQKRLNAYSKAIAAADKVLNKPVKKRAKTKKSK